MPGQPDRRDSYDDESHDRRRWQSQGERSNTRVEQSGPRTGRRPEVSNYPPISLNNRYNSASGQASYGPPPPAPAEQMGYSSNGYETRQASPYPPAGHSTRRDGSARRSSGYSNRDSSNCDRAPPAQGSGHRRNRAGSRNSQARRESRREAISLALAVGRTASVLTRVAGAFGNNDTLKTVGTLGVVGTTVADAAQRGRFNKFLDYVGLKRRQEDEGRRSHGHKHREDRRASSAEPRGRRGYEEPQGVDRDGYGPEHTRDERSRRHYARRSHHE